jgi:hypothetical protein
MADPPLSPAAAQLVQQVCERAEELLQARQAQRRRGPATEASVDQAVSGSDESSSSTSIAARKGDTGSSEAPSTSQQQQVGVAAPPSPGAGVRWGPEQLYQLSWSLGVLRVAPPSQSLMGFVCR